MWSRKARNRRGGPRARRRRRRKTALGSRLSALGTEVREPRLSLLDRRDVERRGDASRRAARAPAQDRANLSAVDGRATEIALPHLASLLPEKLQLRGILDALGHHR